MSMPDHHALTPASVLTEALGGRWAINGLVTKITGVLTTDETLTLARTIEEVAQRQVITYGEAVDRCGRERRYNLQRLMDERWGKVTRHG